MRSPQVEGNSVSKSDVEAESIGEVADDNSVSKGKQQAEAISELTSPFSEECGTGMFSAPSIFLTLSHQSGNGYYFQSVVAFCVAVQIYCDALDHHQKSVAELGRRIREGIKEESRPRGVHHNHRYLGRFSESPVYGGPSIKSCQAERKVESVSTTKPPAEAATRPGQAPSDTERGLERACHLVKTVHDSMWFIRDSW